MSLERDTTARLRTEIVRAVREATGMHEQLAMPVADAILDRLRATWSGSRLYVPAQDTVRRDRAVRAAFDGANHRELCRRYHISRRTLYRILAKDDD